MFSFNYPPVSSLFCHRVIIPQRSRVHSQTGKFTCSSSHCLTCPVTCRLSLIKHPPGGQGVVSEGGPVPLIGASRPVTPTRDRRPRFLVSYAVTMTTEACDHYLFNWLRGARVSQRGFPPKLLASRRHLTDGGKPRENGANYLACVVCGVISGAPRGIDNRHLCPPHGNHAPRHGNLQFPH